MGQTELGLAYTVTQAGTPHRSLGRERTTATSQRAQRGGFFGCNARVRTLVGGHDHNQPHHWAIAQFAVLSKYKNIRLILLCIKTANFVFQKKNCNFVLMCSELLGILLKWFKIILEGKKSLGLYKLRHVCKVNK
jgi:hypothetical protein